MKETRVQLEARGRCHGLKLSQIEITITSVPSLLTYQHIALESEMCVNVHVIRVKMQSSPRGQSEFSVSVSCLQTSN